MLAVSASRISEGRRMGRVPGQVAPVTDPDDAELVRRFQGGLDREDAYRALFERYYRGTHAFFRRRIGDPDVASELNQDLHTTVYTSLDRFRGESSYRTWLFRLALSKLSHLRRRWRVHLDERPVEVDEAFWNEIGSAAPDPREKIDTGRRSAALKRCLANLGEVERAVVFGQYVAGVTLQEITGLLRLDNPSGARAPLLAALRKLRRCLEAAGYTTAGGGA
jgi:RNA polymerase sigma-70 factor (ECF subfamily)